MAREQSKNERRLRQLIKNFAEKAVDNSWKGAAHPDSRAGIEASYNRAKTKLDQLITELEIK